MSTAKRGPTARKAGPAPERARLDCYVTPETHANLVREAMRLGYRGIGQLLDERARPHTLAEEARERELRAALVDGFSQTESVVEACVLANVLDGVSVACAWDATDPHEVLAAAVAALVRGEPVSEEQLAAARDALARVRG